MEPLSLIIISTLLIVVLLAVMFVPHDQDKNLQYKVIADPQHLPTRAHAADAGLDLRAVETVHLSPGQRYLMGTGVCGGVPDGYVGLLCSRSGLAHKDGVAVLNSPGVVDSGYTGELKANLINHGHKATVIRKGDRVAQLLIIPAPTLPVVPVDTLTHTDRGAAGHGSTGKA